MKLTIKKTDKRHTGHSEWRHVVIVERRPSVAFGNASRIQRQQDLNEIRNWCWTTMGPSCELEFWLMLPDDSPAKNNRWVWHTNFENFKIYLRTDADVNWFKLKWL